MNIRTDINRAFGTRRRPHRVRPYSVLTSRRWNELIAAVEQLQDEADR